jgi:DNA mismatch repair protein MutS
MPLTPMMQQYLNIKEQYKDCILFFRLGDFYEMFYEDALIGSRDMEITLTKKSCGEEERAPMCGVPYHAADIYIAKLIEKGHKVAICEQMSDPAAAKGIVDREVVKIITPGTVLSQTMLAEKENNFLACVYLSRDSEGFAYCDISTGEFSAVRFLGAAHREKLLGEITKIQPSEILINSPEEENPEFHELLRQSVQTYMSVLPPELLTERNCGNSIKEHFNVMSEKSVGLHPEDAPELFYAVGGLLGYIKTTQKQRLTHLSNLRIYDAAEGMSLDKATIKNLEITETLFERKVNGSLLGVLDRTKTAMGSRKMKQWLKEPLNSKEKIDLRLNAVECLCEDALFLNNVRESLKNMYDLERLCGRIACGTANGRDLTALKTSIAGIPDIKAELSDTQDALLSGLNAQIHSLGHLYEKIDSCIVDEPPFTIKEGELIRDGYSMELDQLKASIKDGRSWIASLEGKERERTGIKNLKVGYNRVFGYYIEISKSNFNLVPGDYIRKQTLVNCERFITPELKEIEAVVLNAEAKINEMEYLLFARIRDEIAMEIPLIQSTSSALSSVDVLCAFAESSSKLGYTKPEMTDGDKIIIKRGRHAVLERTIKDGVFVSNDLYIDTDASSMLLITGPNMSGKSTYMRQLALIVLMAQSGCFVPAQSAEIGLCDRIYTRIGASDNIAQGQSTFFVEMTELAYILNTATEKSLIILDEIGRGTSTYDGLSIAWAVCEHLTRPTHAVRTLFATHYHELTAMENAVHGVKNLNVEVMEDNGTILFLHKIIEGSASRSYGIHVAKLAGVPGSLLYSAEQKLVELEALNNARMENPGAAHAAPAAETQLSFFSPEHSLLAEQIKALDLMHITPSQAIQILEQLQKIAKDQ